MKYILIALFMVATACSSDPIATTMYDTNTCGNVRWKSFKYIYNTSYYLETSDYARFVTAKFADIKVAVDLLPTNGNGFIVGPKTNLYPPSEPIYDVDDSKRLTKLAWSQQTMSPNWEIPVDLTKKKMLAVLGSLIDNWSGGYLHYPLDLGHGYPNSSAAIYHHDILSVLKQLSKVTNYSTSFVKFLAVHELGHLFDCEDGYADPCNDKCFMWNGYINWNHLDQIDPEHGWCSFHGPLVCNYFRRMACDQ